MLIEESQKLPNVHLVFFYCRYNDPRRNSFVAIVRSLVLQLLHQDESLLPYLFEVASSSGESILSAPSIAKELLEIAVRAFDQVYIIVDGIDECEKAEKKLIST